MKLSKSLAAASAAILLSASAASAISPAQCTSLGGTVDLAAAQCLLSAAQEEEARALGYLPAGSAAATTGATGAGLGAIGASTGAAAAAGIGLALTVVLIGDGGSDTATTTTY